MKVNNNCKPFSRKGKFKAFIERHRIVLKTILITALIFILFYILNAVGQAWRGYGAVGGEVFVFLAPFLIVAGKKCFDDLIDLFK